MSDLFTPTVDRRTTAAAKFRRLSSYCGVSPEDGLGMWIADSDYPTAPVVIDALQTELAHGMLGYGYDADAYHQAITWWMNTRHGWAVDPDWIVTTQGLGHAIATCLDVWSKPGEGVAYFTPVYHEFRLKTQRAGRRPVEFPMDLVEGRYEINWDAAEDLITEDTRILLFCNPQNPSGRMWTAEEQRQVAAFCAKHDLILVADEVHCDLVYPGATHVPMDIAAPDHRNRTVTLFAASKTFNLAGLRVGQAIIPDPDLRATYQQRLIALNYDPATLGVVATTAAFSPEGHAWATAQIAHLQENIRIFEAGIAAIPGVWAMPLQSTYLAWVDFSGTGMDEAEIDERLLQTAKIGPQRGGDFSPHTTLWNRFNLATPRSTVEDAVRRLQDAFSDLQ